MRLRLFLAACLATGQLTAAGPAAGSAADDEINRYRQALAVDPDNAPLRYLLGVALLMEGEAQAATAELRRAYPFLADSREANFHLGLASARAGDPESAQIYFDQAETLGALEQPELYPLLDAWCSIGLLYLDAGQLTEARKLFERVLAADPRRADLHRLLGDLYARGGETDRAVEAFGRYLQNYPDDEMTRESLFALHFNSGLELLEANRPGEARQAFGRGLELLPESPLALYYLGSLDFSEGKIEAAVEGLQKALPNATPELRPGIRSLLHDSALTLLDQRQLRRALAAIEPLVEGPGAEARDLALAGDIHLAMGEFAAAHQCYEQALSREAGNRSALRNLPLAGKGAMQELLARADLHLQRQEYQEAMADLDRLLAIDPADPHGRQLRREMGEILGRQAAEHFAAAKQSLSRNRPREALKGARAGLALVPADPQGRKIEAKALEALQSDLTQGVEKADALLAENRMAEAQQAFERLCALDPANPRIGEGLARIAGRRRETAAAAVQEGERALETGDLAGARTAFAQALRWEPDNRAGAEGLQQAEALEASLAAEAVQAARQAIGAGRLGEASQHFREALKINAKSAIRQELAEVEEALGARARGLLKAARQARVDGDYPRARELYRQRIAISADAEVRREEAELEKEISTAVDARLARAARALREKNLPSAVAGFRSLLLIDPGKREARQGLEASLGLLKEQSSRLIDGGRAAFEAGDLNHSESLARQVLAIDPYQPEARALLARVQAIQQPGARPGDEERLYLRGVEFYTRERYEEAIVAWEKVLTLAPGHGKARMNIEKARRKQRRSEE